MSSIGRGNLRCACGKIRPYWSDKCKQHREEEDQKEREVELNKEAVKETPREDRD